MERLGMYDEPEPVDQEWMGSRALRYSEINRNARDMPLSVTALPDSKPAKHDRFVSNALAEWQLCGFSDRPCRLVLPVSIGEQESKAQSHLQQIAVLARSLNLTLVLPNMHKSRFSACSRNKFETYYERKSLEELGVWVVSYSAFQEWSAKRRVAPTTQVVEVLPQSQNLESKSVLELAEISQAPSWRRCLSKTTPRLEFAKHKLRLVAPSTKTTDLTEFGRNMVEIVGTLPLLVSQDLEDPRPGDELDLPQVYAFDWSLRHQVFPETGSRYLTYASWITDYADRLLDTAGPTAVVQWRMESVPPVNLVACSAGLVGLLKSTLEEESNLDIHTVYFATDYPLEGEALRHSGTFRDIGEHHHRAIYVFKRAFQPGGALEHFRLVSYSELSRTVTHAEETLDGDSGFLGIVDKIISQKADIFISGSGECGRNSSFTKQIVTMRQDKMSRNTRARNEVLLFKPVQEPEDALVI
ncbi:hypothetical protein BDV93DRAFT_601692 [Ceratobasidium sp. AG-I]|nr:hypothetical protein BDV93DRAFT_601692 [Ceratobasidium sp. AG-I]